jgi:hypothetical protein
MIRARRLVPLLLCLPALAVLPPFRSGQPVPAATSALGSKTWVGRYQEVEEYLRTAECVMVDNLGPPKSSQGGSGLKRCVLRPGGPVSRMAWKTFPTGVYRGFRESHKAEIATYELDKLLKLDMVPPTVERELEGHTGSGTFWVEDVVDLRTGTTGAPDRARLEKQLARMAMFDSLIGNGARHLTNTLRDPAWNLILIDHSRAFGTGAEITGDLSRIDKELWGRIEGLTRAQLDAALRPWLEEDQIRAILDRRERMRAAIGRRPR